MKLYEKYLSQKIALTFLAIVSLLILLIWFSRAIGFIKYVTENGVALSQFFYLLILILPWLLIFITPIALFAAILLTFNRMISTNEITILKNSGLTKLKICKPIISLSFLVMIFCAILSFFLMPYANKELRTSRFNIKNNYTNLSFAPQTFETLKDLTIYARSRDEKNKLSGILLYDKRNSQYSLTITAKSGHITTEEKSAMLYMEQGTVQKFNYQTQKTEILNFDTYVFNLTENQNSNSSFNWKVSELYLHELLNPKENLDEKEINQYRSEINQRFTYPLLPIAFTFIGLSLVLYGQFNRHGNTRNTIMAICAAIAFFAITMISYRLIEVSPKLVFLPYLNFFFFLVLSLKILVKK